MILLAETANMLIVTLAHARFSNDTSLLDTYVSSHLGVRGLIHQENDTVQYTC